MTKEQALHSFFSSFGMEAYPVSNVPHDTVFPWLTYEQSVGNFGDDTAVSLHLYFHTRSEAIPNMKVDEIYKTITMGGINVPYDGGIVWVKPGSPFSNSVPDQDDTSIKHRVINLVLQFL